MSPFFPKRALLSLLALGGGLAVFFAVHIPTSAAADPPLTEASLADLAKPGVVRIIQQVTGTARIPAIKVDIKSHLIAVVPNQYTDVPVNEYLSGSGFVIQSDGYIATNSHVVSERTVKIRLASESALSALFGNALFLSDEEMQGFLEGDDGEKFSHDVLNFVIDHSTFDLKNQVVVLRPGTTKRSLTDLMKDGFPADIVSVNENFLEDQKDVALLHINQKDLPALAFGDAASISVGQKVFIFGYPATATINQNNAAESTFTQGVVSALQNVAGSNFKIFQTDAKVSQGSSGGPLLDDQGHVIGIITFQTDELNRTSGDNFAFALPIDLVRQAVQSQNIVPAEGAYGQNFRMGYRDFAARHCDKAESYFNVAAQMNPLFQPGRYLDQYFKKCEEYKKAGTSLDSPWDVLKSNLAGLDQPLAYVFGGALLLFGILGAAFFWLLKQVRRDEKEIVSLEERLRREQETFHKPRSPMARERQSDRHPRV